MCYIKKDRICIAGELLVLWTPAPDQTERSGFFVSYEHDPQTFEGQLVRVQGLGCRLGRCFCASHRGVHRTPAPRLSHQKGSGINVPEPFLNIWGLTETVCPRSVVWRAYQCSVVKVHRGVVTDELKSDLQVSHREVWERRSNSKIVAWRTETWY